MHYHDAGYVGNEEKSNDIVTSSCGCSAFDLLQAGEFSIIFLMNMSGTCGSCYQFIY